MVISMVGRFDGTPKASDVSVISAEVNLVRRVQHHSLHLTNNQQFSQWIENINYFRAFFVVMKRFIDFIEKYETDGNRQTSNETFAVK